jgi:hypothetical protein
VQVHLVGLYLLQRHGRASIFHYARLTVRADF